MRWLGTWRAKGHDDAGASLVLALAFMIGTGVVTGGLLTYASTSLATAVTVRERAELTYATDGALKAAITATANSTYDNAAGEWCLNHGYLTVPGVTASSGANVNSGVNGDAVAVACAPAVGTGAASSQVPINPANRPYQALLTTGTSDAEPGLGMQSNNVLWVHGGVKVNSSITSGGSPCPASPQPPDGNCSELYDDAGQVLASTSCDAMTIFSMPPFRCRTYARYPTPPYDQPPPAPSALDYQVVPSCPSGPLVEFRPGYYDDGAALNHLFAHCGHGSHAKTFWFHPGTYSFDFRDASAAAHVWTIGNDARVVGGTPSGWAPGLTGPSFPGACVSPLESTSNGGVRFVFGGDSQLRISKAHVELCGQYSGSSPPIVLYGATSGSTPEASTQTLKAATARNLTSTPFHHLQNITEADRHPATALLNGFGAGAAARVQVSGFAPGTPIPAGSVLVSATVQVSHRDVRLGPHGNLSRLRVSVTPDRPGAPTVDREVPIHSDTVSSGFHRDMLDVTAELQEEVHAHGFSGMTAIYDAEVRAGVLAVEDLDSVQLTISYVPPSVRAETGCVGAVPYPGPGCALLVSRGEGTALYLQGTVYAPRAALDIQLTNVAAAVFRVGVIARSVRVNVTPSSTYSGPVFDVPVTDSAGPTPLQVFFTAYACPQGSSCDPAAIPNAPWKKVGLARATFSAPRGTRTVTVNGWQIVR